MEMNKLENKYKCHGDGFVNKNFLSETKRWEGLLKEVYSENEFSRVKANKSVDVSKLRVSKPLLRNCINIPETGGRKEGTGGLAGHLGRYEIKAIIRGSVNLSGEVSSPFSLGYDTDSGFRDPILLKLGDGITDLVSPSQVGSLDCRLNNLGEQCRSELRTENGVKKFLTSYLEICDDFANEFSYDSHLKKYDCLNPKKN
jgi:hypothetical protein